MRGTGAGEWQPGPGPVQLEKGLHSVLGFGDMPRENQHCPLLLVDVRLLPLPALPRGSSGTLCVNMDSRCGGTKYVSWDQGCWCLGSAPTCVRSERG